MYLCNRHSHMPRRLPTLALVIRLLYRHLMEFQRLKFKLRSNELRCKKKSISFIWWKLCECYKHKFMHIFAHSLVYATEKSSPPAQNAICTRMRAAVFSENNKKAGGQFSWRSGKKFSRCVRASSRVPYLCVPAYKMRNTNTYTIPGRESDLFHPRSRLCPTAVK